MGLKTPHPARVGRSFTLALGLAATAVMTQAAPPAPSPVLTVTSGPRGTGWKRVFNPFLNEADTRWPSTAGIYEPLIIYNRVTGTYTPWLATGYDWSSNNTKLTFTLRAGVLWSDGTPFTAKDVAFTFDLMRRFPALDPSRVWSFLADVSATSPTTVEFVFKHASTPSLVTIGQQPIVAEHTWKDVAQPAAFDDPSPVATGPFTEVRRFEPGVYELGRNTRYWQAGKPAVGALRVVAYRSNDEIFKALMAGELDWASLFLPNVEKTWVAADPSHHQYWFPDLGQTVMFYLNTRKKPFDDKNVRKALSLCIDRPRIMTEAMSGYASPADVTGLADSQKKWKDVAVAQAATWTKRDVVEANRLLDGAGLARGADGVRVAPGGDPMRYDIHVVEGWSDWVAAAGIIRQNLGEVGVAGSVKPLSYGAWFDALQKGRFDTGIWFGMRGPTPYQFYRGQLDPSLVRPIGEEATDNFHRFGSDEAATLLRRFEASSDSSELLALGSRLQRIYADQAPSLPLFTNPVWGVFTTARFTGFPSRFKPYASGSPIWTADVLPALVELTPR
jgi:peptide/nickel transport system substrate-binding protein